MRTCCSVTRPDARMKVTAAVTAAHSADRGPISATRPAMNNWPVLLTAAVSPSTITADVATAAPAAPDENGAAHTATTAIPTQTDLILRIVRPLIFHRLVAKQGCSFSSLVPNSPRLHLLHLRMILQDRRKRKIANECKSSIRVQPAPREPLSFKESGRSGGSAGGSSNLLPSATTTPWPARIRRPQGGVVFPHVPAREELGEFRRGEYATTRSGQGCDKLLVFVLRECAHRLRVHES